MGFTTNRERDEAISVAFRAVSTLKEKMPHSRVLNGDLREAILQAHCDLELLDEQSTSDATAVLARYHTAERLGRIARELTRIVRLLGEELNEAPHRAEWSAGPLPDGIAEIEETITAARATIVLVAYDISVDHGRS